MLKWTPISPELKENGSFMALSHLENPDELKPVELLETDKNFTQFKVYQNQYSIETALSLGFAPIGNVDSSFRSTAFIWEAMLFTDKITETAVGGKIWGTRWGAGLRVALKVSQTQANAKLSFGAIAASSELGIVNVEYEISGIGITDQQVLSYLPGPGNFNYDTYLKILKAADKVKSFLGNENTDLIARPFQLLMQQPKLTDPISQSRSVLFAVNRIIDRNSLETALECAANMFDADIIQYVYQQFGIIRNDINPSRDERNEARDWLRMNN